VSAATEDGTGQSPVVLTRLYEQGRGRPGQVRSRRGLQADAWLGYVAGLELLPHGHEAAARGVDRDGTVNGYGRELDKLTEALALDP